MKVSIIIPIYNVAPYVLQCLQSVASQTYQGDMECILVDDCGRDESIAICECFIAAYRGSIEFHIIHHEHNRGLSAARNTGIDVAKGEWIYFLDSDDWIFPECISTIVNTLQKHPDSDIVISSTEAEDEYINQESFATREDFPDYSADRMWVMKGLLSRPVIIPQSAWNKLYSLDFIKKYNLRFKEGYVREDEIWSFHYSKYVNFVSFNKHNTYHYRINQNGICQKDPQYKSAFLALDIVSEFLNNITEVGKVYQVNLIVKNLLSVYENDGEDPRILNYCRKCFSTLYKRVDNRTLKVGCFIYKFLPRRILCRGRIRGWARYHLLGQ